VDFVASIKDLNHNEVARFSSNDFVSGKPFWTASLRGAAFYFEVIPMKDGPASAAIRVLRASSNQEPEDKLKSLITNQLERYTAIDVPEILAAGRPVAKLEFFVNNTPYVCTGFLIDKDHLLTNEHCVNSQDICDTTYAIFGYDRDEAVGAGYVTEGVRCKVVIKFDKKLDFALMQLVGSPGERWGHVTLATTSAKVDDLAVIIEHPAGQIKQVSRRDCAVAVFPADGNARFTDFGHSCDTMGGSSGSPVFRRADMQVIGLHHFGVDLTQKEWTNRNRAVRTDVLRNELSKLITLP
jgi:hypothetical protein